ncbi:MAG TPA: M43 family zinc metalloprotease [Bacteroidia bacterium]
MKKVSSCIFSSIVFLVCFYSNIFAQSNFKCGTEVPPAFLNKDRQHVVAAQSISNNIAKCLHKTVSVFVHVVLDSSGKSNILMVDLDSSFANLNRLFAPICLSFKMCKFDSIPAWKYDTFNKPLEEKEVLTLYYTPKVVNWYLVQNIQVPAGVNGYAFFPGGVDAVFLQKQALKDKKTIPHEMGHFFGLYHTFDPSSGSELVNGSNCGSSGDFVCDTEADPYPVGSVNSQCQYQGGAKDSNGDYYTPPVDNIMTYWSGTMCSCRFTIQQYNRMINQYLTARNYLW